MKKTVLLVDDEPDFLQIIATRLEFYGHKVVKAASGQEALEKLHESKPDVVLLDIRMPEKSGLEVLKAIRKKDLLLPVYMLTSFTDESSFERSRKLGASGFIVKSQNLGKEVEDILATLSVAKNYKGETKSRGKENSGRR